MEGDYKKKHLHNYNNWLKQLSMAPVFIFATDVIQYHNTKILTLYFVKPLDVLRYLHFLLHLSSFLLIMDQSLWIENTNRNQNIIDLFSINLKCLYGTEM